MTHRYILQYLAELCQSLKDTRLPDEKKIYFPNELIPADAVNETVFFEVFTGSDKPEFETEKTNVSTVVGSIVINGKTNVGISFLDAIAEALLDPFLPRNPKRKTGFVIFDGDGYPSQRIYVTGIDRSEGAVDKGRYKITIFITFEIYEG